MKACIIVKLQEAILEGYIKNGRAKKTRMRKDRYSALIMANFIARSIQRAPGAVEYSVIGGFAHQIKARKEHTAQTFYQGPDWFVRGMEGKGIISQVRKRT